MSRWSRAAAPWAGLAGGALAWVLHHQILSDSLRFNCAAVSTPRALVALLGATVLCACGGTVSWRVTRGEQSAHSGRVFAAWVSVVCAGIFFMAVLMQAIASLSVPGCFR
jgi:hypothetical protein